MMLRYFILGYITALAAAIRGHEEDSDALRGPPVNDPLYPKQAPYLEAINVPVAWTRLTSTKVARERITVALIDTGVKPDHPDLVSNLVVGYNIIDRNTDTHDRDGHGTELAGILGATINNTKGIGGVMDLVNIMPSFEGYPTFQANEATAIDYVIRNRRAGNIKIILLASSTYEIRPVLANMIKLAHLAGVLTFVTAENDGQTITTKKGNDKDYDTSLGTSSASAIVAGIAAMLYSLAPELSSIDVKKILKDTSKKDLTDSSGKTTLAFGRVDADKAVAKLIPR